ncbi:RNA polymerase sigma 70 family subunit [Rivularia sp. IAM M-261]|nr:RNA polymerase sigma 70 family subunit [Calothrix sp. PCC 7716]GJD21670.1 RNA polymerase sigma 70 family subunit [Rivularia sp. IAM M-261]
MKNAKIAQNSWYSKLEQSAADRFKAKLLMRPRSDVTEMFSTFAQLEANRFSRWLTDTKLRRSMQTCLNRVPEVAHSENFWALYWHKNWQRNSTNRLAKNHLQAYLQEPFYWTSEKTVAKYANSQYVVADFFQIANAEVEIILRDFNAEKSSSLKYYAVLSMSTRLRDILRQRKEADICTNWALLRKISKKIVLEALSQAGLPPTAIAQHRLAWTCFKELYVYQTSGTNKLPEPDSQLWSAITDLYNRERRTQLGFPTKECKSETLEKWLTQTAVYIRAHLFPSVKSLNISVVNSQETETLDLPDPSSESLLADMIATENIQDRERQVVQMSTVLSNALQLLDASSQEMLKLYYQDGLTQQQIMQELGMSQSTVSRRLVKSRESLLAALVKWRQDLNLQLNNSLNSDQVQGMSIALEEYLKNRYDNLHIKK